MRRTAISFLKVLIVRAFGIGLSLGVSVLLANRFGATAPADAFFFVRNLVLELTEASRRVLLAWLVPAFAYAGPADARRLIGRYLVGTALFGAVICVLLALTAPLFAPLLAPGFDAERLALVNQLFALFAPLIPVLLCIAVLSAALNAVRWFGFAEAAMIAPRVMLLAALMVLSPGFGVAAFAAAMVVGGFLGAGLVATAWRKAATRAAMAPAPSAAGPSGKPPTSLALIVLIQVYGQLTLWMDYHFITAFPVGAVATIEYAQRLILLLPGVISASIVTILYTEMAHAREGAATSAAAGAGRLGLLIVAPVVIPMAVFAPDLVDILFGHGRFTADAVDATASLMRLYAPAPIVALFTNVVILSILLNRDLQRIRLLALIYLLALPMRYGLLSGLTAAFGLAGVPLATISLSFVVLMALVVFLPAHRQVFLARENLVALSKLAVAALVMGASLMVMLTLMPSEDQMSLFLRLARIALLAGCGAAVYLACALALRIEDVRVAVKLLARRRT